MNTSVPKPALLVAQSRDVNDFVAACVVCVQRKASHRLPAGLLRPLPIPSHPWSHIAVNFVTGLPLSDGHTAISHYSGSLLQDGPLYSTA